MCRCVDVYVCVCVLCVCICVCYVCAMCVLCVCVCVCVCVTYERVGYGCFTCSHKGAGRASVSGFSPERSPTSIYIHKDYIECDSRKSVVVFLALFHQHNATRISTTNNTLNLPRRYRKKSSNFSHPVPTTTPHRPSRVLLPSTTYFCVRASRARERERERVQEFKREREQTFLVQQTDTRPMSSNMRKHYHSSGDRG
jgi:hypothetical protein